MWGQETVGWTKARSVWLQHGMEGISHPDRLSGTEHYMHGSTGYWKPTFVYFQKDKYAVLLKSVEVQRVSTAFFNYILFSTPFGTNSK